jgi:hypothetical protein
MNKFGILRVKGKERFEKASHRDIAKRRWRFGQRALQVQKAKEV